MQPSRLIPVKWLLAFASLLFISPAFAAQTSAVRPRIAEAINSASRVTIRGNVHPLARPQFDRGLSPDSLSMDHMLLILKRSPDQEAALDALLAGQQDPASPQYHQWLTPQQFGGLYGPADADISVITNWLASQGFKINSVSPGRMAIDFSGTAGQVRNAFSTNIHNYAVNGQQYWANSTDPQIPSALAPVVAGVASLHNFPLKPLHQFAGTFSRSSVSGHVTPIAPSFAFPGCVSSCNLLGPSDFATIYSVLPLWNAGIDGTGQIIAVAQNSNLNIQDVRNFRTLFGLPANDPKIVLNGADPGVGDAEAESESDLDTEWAGAIARNAAIDLVVTASGATDGVDLSSQYIVDNNFAPIMSVSFGLCELSLGATGNQHINQLWQQASAQGITVVVASGDEGSSSCDRGADFATNGLAVNGLASTPYNIAIGGTDFNDIGNPGLFWNSTNASVTQSSAKGYVPETTWNDSCTNSQLTFFGFSGTPEANCNNPAAQNESFLLVAAGSGGASNCTSPTATTTSTCSGGYAKPSWQSGLGVPSDGKRDLPDISLFAGNGFAGNAYIICQMDQDPSGQACNLSKPLVTFQGIGGTSASAPAFAGIVALIDQKTGSRQGNLTPILYKLAAVTSATCLSAPTPAGSCIFYDVTQGTNAMPCAKGSPNCETSGASDSYGILTGFNAGPNYDLATGLGSVNAANLVNNWPGVTSNSGNAGLQLLSSTLTISIPAAGQTGSATVTITALGGFSGTVNLACDVSPVTVNDPPSCSFNPSTVTLNAATTSATVTLKIGSTAPQKTSLIAANRFDSPRFLPPAVLIIVISILSVSLQKRSKQFAVVSLAVLLVSLAIAGCGGGSTAGTATSVTDPGTPSGNYIVGISATSGNIKQTTNMFVTIP